MAHMEPNPAIQYGTFGKRRTYAWKLFNEVKVSWMNFGFEIPSGYVCDMGSIPRSLWWFIAPAGKGNKAFLAHDFVYDGDQITPKDTDGVEMTREQADNMMRDLLEVSGMGKLRRFIAWRGVRRAGWLSWKKSD